MLRFQFCSEFYSLSLSPNALVELLQFLPALLLRVFPSSLSVSHVSR